MNLLQGIWRDLVDKGLWPIAAGLLVVAIAVPVVLTQTGGSSAPPSSTALMPSGSTEGLRAAAVTQNTDAAGPADGPLRNPFVKTAPPSVESATGDPAAAGDATAPGADTGGFPGSTVPGVPGTSDPSTGSGDTTPGSDGKPSSSGENGYDVSLRFGANDATTAYSGVARLTPLPSAANPTLVYLGVLTDGKTAVFMVSEPATAVGDGTCRPKPSQCDTLEMREGETHFLDVTRGDKIVSYRLDVTDVKKVGKGGNTITRASANASSTASDPSDAGRAAIARARKTSARRTLDRYRFLPKRGVVVRLPVRSRASARVAVRKGDAVVASAPAQ